MDPEELRIYWEGIMSKLRKEFDEGPTTGVTLEPGEAAMIYRVLKEAGIKVQ